MYNAGMTIYESLQILAATGCGIQIGGFLLLSLFHNTVFAQWPQDISVLGLFQRFYRFSIVVALCSGILAIFAESRDSGFLLAILGMSHVLLLTHLLPAIRRSHQLMATKKRSKQRRSPEETLQLLQKLQVTVHLFQLSLLIYLVIQLLA